MFKKLFQWLMLSSADPRKTSLSVKMALLAIVPYVLNIASTACGLGLVCLGVDAEGLNQFVQVSENLVLWSLSIVAGIGFMYGFFRKLYRSATGDNKVVASWSEDSIM